MERLKTCNNVVLLALAMNMQNANGEDGESSSGTSAEGTNNNKTVFITGVILLVIVAICFLALLVLFVKRVKKCRTEQPKKEQDEWDIHEPVIVIKRNTSEFVDDAVVQEDSGIAENGSEEADRDSVSNHKDEDPIIAIEDQTLEKEKKADTSLESNETKEIISQQHTEATKEVTTIIQAEQSTPPNEPSIKSPSNDENKEINNNDSNVSRAAESNKEASTESTPETNEKSNGERKVSRSPDISGKEDPAVASEPRKIKDEDVVQGNEEERKEADECETLSPIAEEEGGDTVDRYTDLKSLDTSQSPAPSAKSTTTSSPEVDTSKSPDPVVLQSTTSLFDGSLLESNTSLFERFGLQGDTSDTCILLGPADVTYCDPKTEFL